MCQGKMKFCKKKKIKKIREMSENLTCQPHEVRMFGLNVFFFLTKFIKFTARILSEKFEFT